MAAEGRRVVVPVLALLAVCYIRLPRGQSAHGQTTLNSKRHPRGFLSRNCIFLQLPTESADVNKKGAWTCLDDGESGEG